MAKRMFFYSQFIKNKKLENNNFSLHSFNIFLRGYLCYVFYLQRFKHMVFNNLLIGKSTGA